MPLKHPAQALVSVLAVTMVHPIDTHIPIIAIAMVIRTAMDTIGQPIITECTITQGDIFIPMVVAIAYVGITIIRGGERLARKKICRPSLGARAT